MWAKCPPPTLPGATGEWQEITVQHKLLSGPPKLHGLNKVLQIWNWNKDSLLHCIPAGKEAKLYFTAFPTSCLVDFFLNWVTYFAVVSRRLDVILTDHLPLTTDHLPLTTYHLPLTTYHWPLTTDHLPLTTYHLPLTTDHLPLTTDHTATRHSKPCRFLSGRRTHCTQCHLFTDYFHLYKYTTCFI